MKSIALKLPDELLEESVNCAAALNLHRAEYLRLAISHYNHAFRARQRAERLAEVSLRVRKTSMQVNAEFAAIEHDPEPQARRDLVGRPQPASRERAR